MPETLSDYIHTWTRVLEDIKQKIDDQRLFDAFLQGSKIHSVNGNVIIIEVGSKLAAQILSTKYLVLIQDSVRTVTGSQFELKFDIAANLKQFSTPEAKIEEEHKYFKYANIDPKLTFDNFVTGSCNIEAKQAALYIATHPGDDGYNPLFLYSESGLGKTHLLYAIANKYKENPNGKKAVYCAGSDFLDEIMHLRENSKFDEFKEYVVNHDVLLIDDIQMLADKDKTNALFFEIFQAMYNKGKQIVITSDKHPTELKGFDERLKSRFAGGLSISIGALDVETCVSILKCKIAAGPIPVEAFDEEVLQFIGEKFSKNVRYINEALKKLVWYTTAFKPTSHIDMAITLEALADSIDVRQAKTQISEQKIIQVVADYYSLTPTQLTGLSREGQIADARHVAMYLIKNILDVPYKKIGQAFGGKDHSSVMHGVEKVENGLKNNTQLQEAISELKKRLKA